jgi:hypothetical protein
MSGTTTSSSATVPATRNVTAPAHEYTFRVGLGELRPPAPDLLSAPVRESRLVARTQQPYAAIQLTVGVEALHWSARRCTVSRRKGAGETS